MLTALASLASSAITAGASFGSAPAAGDYVAPSIGDVSIGGLNTPPMPAAGFFSQQSPVLSPGMSQVTVAVIGAVAAAAVLTLLKRKG